MVGQRSALTEQHSVGRLGLAAMGAQGGGVMGVTITATELKLELSDTIGARSIIGGISDDQAARLLAVSTALVERAAPDAPTEIMNECVIRIASYLAPPPSPQSVESDEGLSFTSRPQWKYVMRNSGARDLLSPWRVVTSATVGDSIL